MACGMAVAQISGVLKTKCVLEGFHCTVPPPPLHTPLCRRSLAVVDICTRGSGAGVPASTTGQGAKQRRTKPGSAQLAKARPASHGLRARSDATRDNTARNVPRPCKALPLPSLPTPRVRRLESHSVVSSLGPASHWSTTTDAAICNASFSSTVWGGTAREKQTTASCTDMPLNRTDTALLNRCFALSCCCCCASGSRLQGSISPCLVRLVRLVVGRLLRVWQ